MQGNMFSALHTEAVCSKEIEIIELLRPSHIEYRFLEKKPL